MFVQHTSILKWSETSIYFVAIDVTSCLRFILESKPLDYLLEDFNIWRPYHKYWTRIPSSVTFDLGVLARTICSTQENGLIYYWFCYLQKNYLPKFFLNYFLLCK
jgi:hypothetical protein